MSDYFSNAGDLTLNYPNFSRVERDQHVHHHHTTITTTQSKSRPWIQGTEEEEGEFEQYYEVKRADVELICSIESYISEPRYVGECPLDCERKAFTGRLLNGIGQGSSLTVIGYEERQAREAWLADFKTCTGFLSADTAHLLAISRFRIPLLILARDPVPAAHFMRNVGRLGEVYFSSMRAQLRCGESHVWMDPQRGVLCRGPRGPDRFGLFSGFDENVPSSVDLLKEDVFFRSWRGQEYSESNNVEFNRPTVISSPIASVVTWWCIRAGEDGVLLGNGQTRFVRDDLSTHAHNDEITLYSAYSSYPQEAWVSQAWSVFHTLGISLKDDPSQYKLIVPCMTLRFSLSPSTSKGRRRRGPPIFLFIRQLPSALLQACTTSSLHYWSLNEDGQYPLPATMCHYLGLPVALELNLYRCYIHGWSNDVYKTMRQYQVARGFNPSTTNFAQSLEAPAYYEPIQNDSDRFEEIDMIEGKNLLYSQPSSPPVSYRPQTPDESDIASDTDDNVSDTDSDSNIDWWFYVVVHTRDTSSPEMDNLCVRFESLALG